MSDYRDGTEEERHCIAHIGKPLGTVFNELWVELVSVSYKATQLQVLYGKKEHVQILNETSPTFFSMVQEVLWKDIVLHIARLTDRRSKANLTIDRLRGLVSKDMKGEVDQLISIAKERSEFAQKWRNKRLAHFYYEIATAVRTLPPPNLKEIKEAIISMLNLMNLLSEHYLDTTYAIDLTSRAPMDLLQVLHHGLKAQAVREER